MPTGNLTLLDLAARSGSDTVAGLIEDVITVAPEFGIIPARPKAGTTYKVTRRTGLPTAAFRDANEGLAASKSTYVQEVRSMYFLDCQLEVDEAIVKGDDRSIGDVLTDEAAGALEAALIAIGSQVWYGTSADAKGFVGVRSAITMGTDNVTCGGTTNTTSAYLVWLDDRGVHLKVGNDGAIDMPAWMTQQVIKSGSGSTAKKCIAHVSNISSYLGLSIGSAYSCFAATGIGATLGTNGFTDAKGAALLAKVPLNRRAGLRWFMNRTAAAQLQYSRSAVGQIDAGAVGRSYAPMPTECQGFPITITDSIVDTETNS